MSDSWRSFSTTLALRYALALNDEKWWWQLNVPTIRGASYRKNKVNCSRVRTCVRILFSFFFFFLSVAEVSSFFRVDWREIHLYCWLSLSSLVKVAFLDGADCTLTPCYRTLQSTNERWKSTVWEKSYSPLLGSFFLSEIGVATAPLRATINSKKEDCRRKSVAIQLAFQ